MNVRSAPELVWKEGSSNNGKPKTPVPLFPRVAAYIGFGAVCCSLGLAAFAAIWRIGGFSLLGIRAVEIPVLAAAADALFCLAGLQLMSMGYVSEQITRIQREFKDHTRAANRSIMHNGADGWSGFNPIARISETSFRYAHRRDS